MRLIVTAGYDRSQAAILMCELLQRTGHQIQAVFVVSSFSLNRIFRTFAKAGVKGVLQGVRKSSGTGTRPGSTGPLEALLEKHSIRPRSLNKWCRHRGVQRVAVASLNSNGAISRLKSLQPDAVAYAGGGILGPDFITAANGHVVNPHSGPLPQIRGMNAIEWALLLDEPLQATVHLIDEGIDSGPILGRFEVEPQSGDSLEDLRERAVVAGVEGVVQLLNNRKALAEIPRQPNVAPPGTRQCFTMAPAIRALAEFKLARRLSGG